MISLEDTIKIKNCDNNGISLGISGNLCTSTAVIEMRIKTPDIWHYVRT